MTQDREKSTDSVEGAAAQESIELVEGEESTVSLERPTTHLVPLSSSSTLSGTFPNDLLRPNPLLLCTSMLLVSQARSNQPQCRLLSVTSPVHDTESNPHFSLACETTLVLQPPCYFKY